MIPFPRNVGNRQTRDGAGRGEWGAAASQPGGLFGLILCKQRRGLCTTQCHPAVCLKQLTSISIISPPFNKNSLTSRNDSAVYNRLVEKSGTPHAAQNTPHAACRPSSPLPDAHASPSALTYCVVRKHHYFHGQQQLTLLPCRGEESSALPPPPRPSPALAASPASPLPGMFWDSAAQPLTTRPGPACRMEEEGRLPSEPRSLLRPREKSKNTALPGAACTGLGPLMAACS